MPGGSFTIFWGTSSGISALGPTLGLGTQHARTGASVATAGDVNGDGLADIVVGSPVAERATVYCGKKTGNPVNCGTLSFGQNGSEYGATVSTAKNRYPQEKMFTAAYFLRFRFSDFSTSRLIRRVICDIGYTSSAVAQAEESTSWTVPKPVLVTW